MNNISVKKEISTNGFPVCSFIVKSKASLNNESIVHSVCHLVSYIPKLLQEVETEPDRLFPIYFEFDDDLRITEKTFWHVLLDTNESAIRHIVEFVEAISKALTKSKIVELPLVKETYAIGSHALFESIIWLRDENQLREVSNLQLYDAFFSHLSIRDMDHEAYEDDYISIVLKEALCFIDRTRYVKLLHLRLNNGQESLVSKDFKYLHQYVGHRYLKELIDYHIELRTGSTLRIYKWKTEDIAKLCAVVYGTNEWCINEVLTYFSNRLNEPINDISEWRLKEINELKAESDKYHCNISSKDGFITTGFHKYDLKSKVWSELSS